MPSILPSSGDPDVRWLKRLFGSERPPCADPDHPECKKRAEEQRRAQIQDEHEHLQRMEDEIAVMMRERENGH